MTQRIQEQGLSQIAQSLQPAFNRLFADLTDLEDQHRTGAIDPERFAQRRRELVAALERVYAALDEEAA